jgi:hypothetical protein
VGLKEFVKGLDKNGHYFKYICNKFSARTYEKLKAGIFIGSQIWKLTTDEEFEGPMKQAENETS